MCDLCVVRLPLSAEDWWRSTPRHFHVHKKTVTRQEEDVEDVSVGKFERCQIVLSHVSHLCRAVVAGACGMYTEGCKYALGCLESSHAVVPNMFCLTWLLLGREGDQRNLSKLACNSGRVLFWFGSDVQNAFWLDCRYENTPYCDHFAQAGFVSRRTV